MLRAVLLSSALLLSVCGVQPAWGDVGATPVDSIHTLPGFHVELLYSVPREEQGSWVSLTTEKNGRLIACDQYGQLYRITPPAVGIDLAKNPDAVKVERIDLKIGMAQGLLYAHDSLYISVNANQNKKSGPPPVPSGLYRARDTNGDDTYDELTQLRAFKGSSEHGPHAVLLGPDGMIYVCAGNHTDPPNQERSVVPQVWDEDFLLSRQWDARGHARGKLAPGGWIARTDPDGKEFEIVAVGFRNEYDIAFNTAGELFTYDADMEWDIGSPWYRPTRVNHVISGAEFGWRSGTGKWPEYYPDSFGSVVDIGPGSPTGITFGAGARFPAKYQRSLFIADWSYGTVYAVHLTPDGATYTGEAEKFLTAQPLPVTDMVVHPDGALYFAIGGRETQSGLYRVTYLGDESTDAAPVVADAGAELRDLRHQLEALQREPEGADLDFIWKHLGHADRAIRFAARTALEHQPVVKWRTRAVEEKDPAATVQAIIALARHGNATNHADAVHALNRVDWNSLTAEQQLDLIRAYNLVFIRLGRGNETSRSAIVAKLDATFPAKDRRINRELAALLVYLNAPQIAERTLAQLQQSGTQEDQTQFAFILKDLDAGWTPELREQYFRWFSEAAAHRGGMSFEGFLKNIRDEAVATLTEAEKEQYKPILEAEIEPIDPLADLNARPLVKKYTVDDLVPVVDAGLHDRNFENGRKLFSTAACFRCHRVRGEGGSVGPDLTGAGGRFNHRNLLESMVEPSKVISDQYAQTQFVLEDGKVVTGRVINLAGDNLRVLTNMFDPSALEEVNRNKIELMQPANTSMMPDGLLDRLTEDEILDLIAYLKSGGDPRHEAFAQPKQVSSAE
ncbi:MAG: c-type cytochrome [Planctomycetaceae bacterium]|nr:c-type cytochrome [Planctomycetaceae bacterium]